MQQSQPEHGEQRQAHKPPTHLLGNVQLKDQQHGGGEGEAPEGHGLTEANSLQAPQARRKGGPGFEFACAGDMRHMLVVLFQAQTISDSFQNASPGLI